jgi:hypothetical protein
MLEVFLFGKSLNITQMFRYNPIHWCRYSAIVDSGEFNGKCMISFLAKQGVDPFKFWIDQIELYEGESPIGKNCARLEYQYYNMAYVSPDVISPLPFAFEWIFDNDQRPQEIQYIVELPEEVEIVDVALGRITWAEPDYSSKVEIEKIIINHRSYIRMVAHVPCLPGDQKQFTDYVVPVGMRDYWEYTLGQYSGRISLCLYVRSKVPAGSYPFYYYAKWDKGQQPRKKLDLEVTAIPEIRCLGVASTLLTGRSKPC